MVLCKENRKTNFAFNNKFPDSDLKVKEALSFALGVHLSLYVPAVACAFVQRYVNDPHMIIVKDVCLLLFLLML